MKIIAAMSKNRVIGYNGKIPWHLKTDLQRFRNLTTGHPVIMGRKTFESIGKPLPDRINVVITRDDQFRKKVEKMGVITVSSVDEVKKMFKNRWEDTFVIGGGQIYNEFINDADTIYLTVVDIFCKGDSYFPKLPNGLKLVNSQVFQDKLPYEYRVYTK